MDEKRYKLINVTKVARYEDRILLIDDEINEIEPYSDDLYEALKMLQCGGTKKSLIDLLKSEKVAEDLIETLMASELLKEDIENPYINTMLQKQWYYLDSLSVENTAILQNNISTKTVGIIGVGGIGTVVIDHLVRAGVKKFVIVDFDVICENNLNRQVLFTQEDIGRKKIDIVKRKIELITANSLVWPICMRITDIRDLEVLKEYPIDILVNAADTPYNIEEMISEFGMENNIPTISCSVGRNYGTWGPLYIPEKTVCYKCYTDYEKQQMTEYEKFIFNMQIEPLQASFGPTNTVVSVMMAKDIIHFLALGADCEKIPSINARCGINFETLEFTKNVVDKDICTCQRACKEE